MGTDDEGIIKAYAVTSDTRFAQAPDIPTFAEMGVPSVFLSSWMGGLMTRKLSVTESQKTAQFFGTSSRRKRRTDRQKSL
jgi:tripartite-type tricarboxylate transporter receptor subunit TctC